MRNDTQHPAHGALVTEAAARTLSLSVNGGASRGYGDGAEHHVFSYRNDFDYLWGIGPYEGSGIVEQFRGEGHILLVWDGLPQDGRPSAIPAAPYVTAFDWAVFFLIRLAERTPLPRVRISILDFALEHHRASFSCKLLPILLPRLPWIRPFSIGTFPFFPEPPIEVDPEFLAILKELWAGELSSAEGRHSVSNLVAPFLLADGLCALDASAGAAVRERIHGASSAGRALLILLRTLRVLQPTTGAVRGDGAASPLKAALVEADFFGQFAHGVRFLLVDDRAAFGFHDVVAALLLGEDRVSLQGLESASADGRYVLRSAIAPDVLLDWLQEATQPGPGGTIDWEQPRMIGGVLSTHAARRLERFDVLLLDLRLFDPNEPAAEAEHLKRLRQFYFGTRANVSTVVDDTLRRVAEAVWQQERGGSRTADAAADPERLAFLPLLLSHLDPSLPIILFSSTRQRAVIEALQNRPNIITTFCKPGVTGYREGATSVDYLLDLREALTTALRLHEARCVWNAICQIQNAEWKQHTVFEVRASWKDAEKAGLREGSPLAVFNGNAARYTRLSDKRGLGNTRYAAGRAGEACDVKDIRRRFARSFVEYVLGNHPFDFASVPWEWPQGQLVPEWILTSVIHLKLG
jgi:hypothetical protein